MVNVDSVIEKKAESVDELTEDDLKQAYEQAKKEYEDKYPDKSDSYKERAAIRSMSKWVSAVQDLEEKTITIITVGEKRDTIARKREEARDMYHENPQKAVEKGYTDPDGNPLFRSGQREGDKMPKHLWRKDAYGVDEKGNFVQLACTNNDVMEEMEKVNKYSKVNGKLIDRSDYGDRVKEYRMSTYTEFEIEEDVIDDEKAVEMLKDSDIFEDMYSIRELVEQIDYPFITTLGFVDFYEQEIPDDRNRRLSLKSFDDEIQITAWLPDDIELNFNTGSEVYILGTMKLGDMWRDDMDQKPLQFAQVYDIIPDPEGILEEGEEEVRIR